MNNRMQTDSPYECAQCHLGFTSVEAFDAHQEVTDDERGIVECHEPSDVGLVWQERSAEQRNPAGWRVP